MVAAQTQHGYLYWKDTDVRRFAGIHNGRGENGDYLAPNIVDYTWVSGGHREFFGKNLVHVANSPFLILDSKMGSIVCIPLVHDFRLYTSHFFFYLSLKGLGTCYLSLSDFGFENGLNRLYFVTTWLYTSFFVCTSLFSLTILRCISSIHV